MLLSQESPEQKLSLKGFFIAFDLLVRNPLIVPKVVDNQPKNIGISINKYFTFLFLELVPAREHGLQCGAGHGCEEWFPNLKASRDSADIKLDQFILNVVDLGNSVFFLLPFISLFFDDLFLLAAVLE